jgi:hypothetical protein
LAGGKKGAGIGAGRYCRTALRSRHPQQVTFGRARDPGAAQWETGSKRRARLGPGDSHHP